MSALWVTTGALLLWLLFPAPALAEVELFALAGWPVYQRQTDVTGAGDGVGTQDYRSFGPQQNPVAGGGLTWWGLPSVGLRGDFMIAHPNIPPAVVVPGKGWGQRMVAGTVSVLGRRPLTESLSAYGGIGLARTSSKQCDEIGCTPNTQSWGGVVTVGLQATLWTRLGMFGEVRHLSTSFRFANEPQGAFASDVNLTTAHVGLTWQVW